VTRGIFVTGTDTGAGKTFVACALLQALCDAGSRAIGLKPVAAGFAANTTDNEDVVALAAAGNVAAPLRDRNPYAFAEPIAPHLAAGSAGVAIDVSRVESAYARLAECAEAIVVEGAGGVLVPLDARLDMLDIAQALRLPVLLDVGMRVGCLNHALLSALAVQRRGLALAGWIANELPPGMPWLMPNVETLERRLGMVPCAVFRASTTPRFAPAALSRLGFS
jgi:dethiobiotin synthetase